jgi:glutathione S-transferase
MAEFKYTYLNFMGRGELARLIFAAAGQIYDDIRFEYGTTTEFKKKAPFGQVRFCLNDKILGVY